MGGKDNSQKMLSVKAAQTKGNATMTKGSLKQGKEMKPSLIRAINGTSRQILSKDEVEIEQQVKEPVDGQSSGILITWIRNERERENGSRDIEKGTEGEKKVSVRGIEVD